MRHKNNIIIVLLVVIIAILTVMVFAPQFAKEAGKYVDTRILTEIKTLPLVADHVINGQLEYVEGSVETRESALDGWREAEGGEVIGVGTEVRTLAGARAVITFEDGSIARLSENSQMAVSNTNTSIDIQFTKGAIFNKVVTNAKRLYRVSVDGFEVRALGTAFGVEKVEGVEPEVTVIESTVEVKKTGGAVVGTVTQGEKSSFGDDAVELAKKDLIESDLAEEFIAWNLTEDKVAKEGVTKKADSAKASSSETKNPPASDDSGEAREEVANDAKGISLSGKQTDSGVKLSWSSDSSKHGFKVLRSTGNNPTFPAEKSVYVSDSGASSYHWNTDAGKKYYFRVCMYNGKDGCFNYSNTVAVEAPSGSSSKDDDYASSISLSADKKDDDEVKLKWSLSGGGAPNGFKVLVSKSKNPSYPDDSVSYISDGDTRSFTVKNLKEEKDYHFRVCLYNGKGCEKYSDDEEVEL